MMRTTSDRTADRRPASSPRSVGVLGGLLVLCVGGGFLIGTLFPGTFEGLDVPPWAPPEWLFPPVWIVLYTLMAVSAWMVWRDRARYRRRALTAFGVQLVLNFLWTPTFFGANAQVAGLVVIAGVLLAVGWWTFESWRVRALAGALQLPYLAWVAFATVLNAAIVG